MPRRGKKGVQSGDAEHGKTKRGPPEPDASGPPSKKAKAADEPEGGGRKNANQRDGKQAAKERAVEEQTRLASCPWEHYNPATQLRTPPPVYRYASLSLSLSLSLFLLPCLPASTNTCLPISTNTCLPISTNTYGTSSSQGHGVTCQRPVVRPARG